MVELRDHAADLANHFVTGFPAPKLATVLRQVAEAQGVAAKMIATVDELEALAQSDEADVPAVKGWRRRIFGARALELKHGRLALTVENGKVTLLEWQDAEAASQG